MSVREFQTPDGERWRVWAVRPNHIIGERRRDDRRITPVESLDDPPVLERRLGVDRRHGDARRRRALPGTLLPDAWQEGWLVFERTGDGHRTRATPETRRLAPIPDCWDRCSPEDLADHLRDATTAGASRAHHD